MRHALRPRLRLHANNAVELITNRHLRRSATFRRYAFDVARTVTNGVLVDHADYKFLVHTQDKAVGRQTFSDGAFDLEVMEAALRFLESEVGADVLRDRTLVDVGANIGTTAIPAALTWGARRVLAIEPSPTNFALLRCNVILNDLEDRVECVNAAVTSTRGDVELELSGDNSGDHRVRVTTSSGEFEEQRRATVRVRGESLDSILATSATDPNELGLVWVDTQGHEGHVLASSIETMTTGVPFIIEYWPYALRRADGLELAHSMIESHFTTVLDIRRNKRLSARDIASLCDVYQGQAYTDLALIP